VIGISVVGQTAQWPNFPIFKQWWLNGAIERARSAGIASAEEIADWLRDLEERDKGGRFFSSFTVYRVSARKP
jgi:hypothetical protein